VAPGQVFPRVLRFFPVNLIPPVSYYTETRKKLTIFITGSHNKPQGFGASVVSAAGPFSTKKASYGMCTGDSVLRTRAVGACNHSPTPSIANSLFSFNSSPFYGFMSRFLNIAHTRRCAQSFSFPTGFPTSAFHALVLPLCDFVFIPQSTLITKGKGKAHSVTGHEVPEGE
jgi:hypothetical protein